MGTLTSAPFVLECKCGTIAVFVGRIREVTIPVGIRAIGEGRFPGRLNLSTVRFDYGSRLSSIRNDAFSICRSLSSIVIPASVIKLDGGCFHGGESRSTVAFESTSHLSRMEDIHFADVDQLHQFGFLPSSVRELPE
jgi:hypothetical protein